MSEYSRAEIEEMMEKWLQANKDAEAEGDWVKHLGAMYTDDAHYSWNIGPYEEFNAYGRKEIEELAIGYQMDGFQGWEYPYHDIIIDEKRGTVVCFWKQIGPGRRADGSRYEIAGIGGSWFEYAGDFKWKWQKDFFDFGNAKEMFFEMAGDGHLNDIVKKKIQRQARGELLPGHYPIGHKPNLARKVKNLLAMIKIALLGK